MFQHPVIATLVPEVGRAGTVENLPILVFVDLHIIEEVLEVLLGKFPLIFPAQGNSFITGNVAIANIAASIIHGAALTEFSEHSEIMLAIHTVIKAGEFGIGTFAASIRIGFKGRVLLGVVEIELRRPRQIVAHVVNFHLCFFHFFAQQRNVGIHLFQLDTVSRHVINMHATEIQFAILF